MSRYNPRRNKSDRTPIKTYLQDESQIPLEVIKTLLRAPHAVKNTSVFLVCFMVLLFCDLGFVNQNLHLVLINIVQHDKILSIKNENRQTNGYYTTTSHPQEPTPFQKVLLPPMLQKTGIHSPTRQSASLSFGIQTLIGAHTNKCN